MSAVNGVHLLCGEWDSVIFQGETNSPNQSPIISFLSTEFESAVAVVKIFTRFIKII